jgi:hypothetical protein
VLGFYLAHPTAMGTLKVQGQGSTLRRNAFQPFVAAWLEGEILEAGKQLPPILADGKSECTRRFATRGLARPW